MPCGSQVSPALTVLCDSTEEGGVVSACDTLEACGALVQPSLKVFGQWVICTVVLDLWPAHWI